MERTDVSGVGFIVSQLSYGGAERQTALLIERLVNVHGIRPWVYSMSPHIKPFGPLIRQLGCELVCWERRHSFEIQRVRAIRRHVQARHTRLVHAVHYEAAAYAKIALVGLNDVQILPSIRSSEYRSGGIKGTLLAATLRRTPRVIVNSYKGATFLRQTFGVRDDRLRVIPNAIVPQSLPEDTRNNVRRRLALPIDCELVVYIGKDTPQKDIPLLQAIAERLLHTRSKVVFIVVGYGLDGTVITDWARANNGRVLAMGPREDVYDLLAAGDALLLTSRAEGCPNVVLEAMMLGVPVVATDAGDCARLIDHGTNGFVFPRGDVEAGCAALTKLLDSPALRQEFGERAHAKMLANYSPDAMVSATMAVYTELCNLTRS